MRCNVCFLPIHDENTEILCPFCRNSFHRDHLAAWLLNESKCPVCRTELDPEFLEDLKPKTEKERRELEQILMTLQGLGNVLESWESSFQNRRRLKKMRTTTLEPVDKPSLISIFVKFGLPLVIFAFWVVILIIVFGQ